MSRPQHRTNRLLLAEDDRDLRELLASALEEDGAIVTAVADGAEALRQLRAGGFDAAILDARMPRLTGLEVLRHLSGEVLQVVLLSSFPDPDLRERALALGAARVIEKPLDAAALCGTVREVLESPLRTLSNRGDPR